MSDRGKPKIRFEHALGVLGIVAVFLFVLGAPAGAALPSPALQVLGVAAPTYLPPQQSEVQRVTVEGEGGAFTLSQVATEGTATPIFLEARLDLTEGSTVATIESVTGSGTAEVGDRITVPGGYEETYVLSCSADCRTPGSTIELSTPAGATEAGARRQILTRGLDGVVGSFKVGEEVLSARNYEGEPPFFGPYFPSGTVVTAVGPGTITLSNPTTGQYDPSEGEVGPLELTTGPLTAPIPFDAPAEVVQEALNDALGAGSVTVTGGPGGDAARPYFVRFGGSLADRDVPQILANFAGLTGAHPFVHVFTTIPGGVGTGQIVALPANIGSVRSNGQISIRVGPLPANIVTSGQASGKGWLCPNGAGESTITCTTRESIGPIHGYAYPVSVPIEIKAGAATNSSVDVAISGGGSLIPDLYNAPIVVSDEQPPFGIQAAFSEPTEADGSPSTQAGGHPFEASAYVMLNTRRLPSGGLEPLVPVGESKDVTIDLPPGLIGNPLSGRRCPQGVLIPPAEGSTLCTDEMTVGNLDPLVGQIGEGLDFGASGGVGTGTRLYNDLPPRGAAAEFSTQLASFALVSVLAGVNSEEDFGIRLTGPNNPNLDKIFGIFAGFEGVPVHGQGVALLTNPTDCAESTRTKVIRVTATSYQEPFGIEKLSLPQPTLTGCDKLKFEAIDPATGQGQVGFDFTPTAESGKLVDTGSTAVGALAHLHIDQGGLIDPGGLATPHLKRAVIGLPEGMTLNPSAADGLQGCSEAQIGYRGNDFALPNPIRFNGTQPACPDGSKIGEVEIKTPLVDNSLSGEVFLARQDENPFGSLLAVYLVVNDPATGVLIKLSGKVQADPGTGRLTAIFDHNPQLPFEDLYLRFRGGGPRSLFATPEVCGSFPAEAEWTPWSAPESGPPAQTASATSITDNCASGSAARPFGPGFEAGTTSNGAGSFAPLVVRVTRKDGEQELTDIAFTLPKGLLGKLAGIPYCTTADISTAEQKTGRQEQAHASCPAQSRVGTVDTGAGVGPLPFHVSGNLYLAGPYKGAPISTVAIVPAVAGPLDLGNVVIRAPLYIDRESAALTAKTDPIPTILKGIPLKIRSVSIHVDRQGFILNPTDCTSMQASASFSGGSGATSKASNRFQAVGCKQLRFSPKLKVSTKGSIRRNGHPALTAVLSQASAQANIARVSVTLPHSEFLEQAHIRSNCTRIQFAADQCPKGSIYGHVEAVTPLLAQPLRGPVYLRSSSNKLPDLVAVLKGPPTQPVEIDLDGRIDSVRGGIRTTFDEVPDAPISKFVLRLAAGKKSLIVNSTNICRGTHKATIAMTGQNGGERNFLTPLKAECGKKQSKKSKRESVSTKHR